MNNPDSQTLHITNGDSAAGLIRAAGFDGTVLPWRDPMHYGPFPQGLTVAQTSDTSARFLAGDTHDLNTTQQEFIKRDTTLANYKQFPQTLLWFEHDLLDQLQILQILSAIDDTANVSMICIDQFEGVAEFRGLGQLSPAQIASLYDSREPVTSAQLVQAKSLWALFCDSNPELLLAQIQHEPLLFAYLKRALLRHFQEFPWSCDGLTRTERQLLSLVSSTINTPAKLFGANMALEDA
ncbi:MAG: DUF1835 domain-containing protein, partial [Pseudomonadota bacterium]